MNGPHSRACGIQVHDHGPSCHSNCPTCHGRDETHLFEPRPGTDWCRVCGQLATDNLHGLAGMVRFETGWDYPPKVAQSYPILAYFDGDSDLDHLAQQLAQHLPRGPEVSAGLRFLLQARDCFNRASR